MNDVNFTMYTIHLKSDWLRECMRLGSICQYDQINMHAQLTRRNWIMRKVYRTAYYDYEEITVEQYMHSKRIWNNTANRMTTSRGYCNESE